jgi:hypothetical protein
MRDRRAWRADATATLRDRWQPEEDKNRARHLLDVELALYLMERVAPGHPCSDVWALLGGYPFLEASGTPVDATAEQVMVVARHLVLRFKDRYDWDNALRWYVTTMPETLRGYEVNLETGTVRRRHPRVLPDRWEIYEHALTAAPPDRSSPLTTAGHGQYLVDSAAGPRSVTIPQWLPLDTQGLGHDLTARADREPIEVTWEELTEAAARGDALEEEIGWAPRSNWAQRLADAELELRGPDNTFSRSEKLTIDGLLNLVGMVGAGKSTLVDVLILWAASSQPAKRVCVIADNVTALLRKVVHLQALGISAAPVVGESNRVLHLRRLHRLTAPGDGRIGPTGERMFDLVSTACALDGLRDHEAEPWEVQRAPCRNLLPLDGSSGGNGPLGCPVWRRCARHQPSRDLVDADVWVATTPSLVHTPLPQELNGERLRYLEAAWRRSDLLIVDEADQVQTQLDSVFSPSQRLIGQEGDAWLDEVDKLTRDWVRRAEREQMHDPTVRRWKTTLGTAMTAVDMLYGVLSRDRDRNPAALDKRWLDTGYFTDWTLTQQLAQSWAGYGPKTSRGHMPSEGWETDPVYRKLRASFSVFIDDPLSGVEPGDATAARIVALAKAILNDSDEPGRLSRIEDWLRALQKDWADDGAQLVIDERDLERQAARLEFTIFVAVLANKLNILVELFREVEFQLGLEGTSSTLFHRAPRDFQPVVPESPMGNVLGFQYLESDDTPGRRRGPMGQLRFFRCTGIGRWVLLHLHELYHADSRRGPNVLLLSGTSWAATSPRYHIDIPVNAILKPRKQELEAIRNSRFEFFPLFVGDVSTPIRVSGAKGEQRERALEQMVAALADPGAGRSILEQHRDALPEGRRRLLLLVGSYAEARIVADHLIRLRDSWRDHVRRLIADDEEFTDYWDGPLTLRRGDVGTLADTAAWILVAPLLAMERGHNILNNVDQAAIGAAYFLVRPHPRPDDLSYIIQRINQWACRQINDGLPTIPEDQRIPVGKCAEAFRRSAHRKWRGLLHMKLAYSSMPDLERRALAWTLLVTIWQVIGRLVRGGVPAEVYFCDAAFAPGSALRNDTAQDDDTTSLLLGLRDVLAPYFQPESEDPDRYLVEALYGCLHEALAGIEGL